MTIDITLPSKVWGTKGFVFWTFLSMLLLGSGSQRILELGSGRSTITFAEYAKYRRARFVSLETSREWYDKGKLELHFLQLPTEAVKLIEVDSDTGWYMLDQFHSFVAGLSPVDCVLIDGPNEKYGNSAGMRDTKGAIRELKKCCATADLILIDDVHRRHVFETIKPTLSSPDDYQFYYFDYRIIRSHLNSLCICARNGSKAAKVIPAIERVLGLKLRTDGKPEQCPEP